MSQDQSASAQQQHVSKFLQMKVSADTLELRHKLDVLIPAARTYELRHKHGMNIVAVWTIGVNPDGGTHRIARYVLKPGKYGDTK